jgi:uncharacterized damage-inducible protein DinB
MTVEEIRTFYDYGYWANKRLFREISQLTDEEFTRPVAGSYGSIRNTMVHVMSAEWGWLGRCGGPPRGPRLDPKNYPTSQSLVDAWIQVEKNVREFLSSLKDEELERRAEYTNDRAERRSMPVGELMTHAAIHGVHHRGQVALQLRMLGRSPADIDILIYYGEKRSVAAW